MKLMKKLVVMAALAAGSVVGLSSCNAMLDVIYPERQIVNVTVAVAFSHSPVYVTVQLLDSSGNSVQGFTSYSYQSYDAVYNYYDFQFTKLKNDTYGLYTVYKPALSSSFYTYYFYDPSNFYTSSVAVPYFKSSDITGPLTVYFP
ncbi:MAG TPA: hypothetical protein VMU36_01140 [Spirochaetia bacterium]|nr:hypothetical protein [Spirochaetia bacterium]